VAVTLGEWVDEMENEGLFEGDIMLDPDEKPKDVNSYASIKGGRWPNPVPYDPSGTGSSGAVQNAIKAYEAHTCLRFKKKTNERAYIRFYSGSGCHSPVGYRYNRVNSISLGWGCGKTGIAIHEMGHTLGMYHEQSRPDRDQYVRIKWDAITDGHSHNFRKHSSSIINSLGTPYDYNSIMHYGSKSFGKGLLFKSTTIETIDKSKQRVIGQRSGLSKIDIKQLNLMYCSGGTGTGGGSTCTNNSVRCDEWANRTPSECKKNPTYMNQNCRKACKLC